MHNKANVKQRLAPQQLETPAIGTKIQRPQIVNGLNKMPTVRVVRLQHGALITAAAMTLCEATMLEATVVIATLAAVIVDSPEVVEALVVLVAGTLVAGLDANLSM
tara:strand:- start:26 stop:343 length:318 start_codon:yes stop_codon:yes gene_type:complete